MFCIEKAKKCCITISWNTGVYIASITDNFKLLLIFISPLNAIWKFHDIFSFSQIFSQGLKKESWNFSYEKTKNRKNDHEMLRCKNNLICGAHEHLLIFTFKTKTLFTFPGNRFIYICKKGYHTLNDLYN